MVTMKKLVCWLLGHNDQECDYGRYVQCLRCGRKLFTLYGVSDFICGGECEKCSELIKQHLTEMPTMMILDDDYFRLLSHAIPKGANQNGDANT